VEIGNAGYRKVAGECGKGKRQGYSEDKEPPILP